MGQNKSALWYGGIVGYNLHSFAGEFSGLGLGKYFFFVLCNVLTLSAWNDKNIGPAHRFQMKSAEIFFCLKIPKIGEKQFTTCEKNTICCSNAHGPRVRVHGREQPGFHRQDVEVPVIRDKMISIKTHSDMGGRCEEPT